MGPAAGHRTSTRQSPCAGAVGPAVCLGGWSVVGAWSQGTLGVARVGILGGTLAGVLVVAGGAYLGTLALLRDPRISALRNRASR